MSKLEQIYSDLLNVEVSTIIKQEINGNSMPSLPFAFLDIIESYARCLLAGGVDLDPYFAPSCSELRAEIPALYAKRGSDSALTSYFDAAAQAYLQCNGRECELEGEAKANALWSYLPDLWPVFEAFEAQGRSFGAYSFNMSTVTNGWDSFERLRIACHIAQDKGLSPTATPIRRMIHACNELKYLLQGIEQRFGHKRRAEPQVADWSELVPKTRGELLRGALHDKQTPSLLRLDDFRTVRKIWELGTEQIALQTSVQVDGDVVTRISSSLVESKQAQLRELVINSHKQSVSTGLTHWRFLVETVRELFGSIYSGIRGR